MSINLLKTLKKSLICQIILFMLTMVFMFNFINTNFEAFSNYNLENVSSTQNNSLLLNWYPIKKDISVTDNSYDNIWNKYPTFKLGSYEQITNNLKYFNSPDIGTCIPASFCDSIYNSRQNKTNIITPLPPANSNGIRVNYYTSSK
jgi:hypothetical protein